MSNFKVLVINPPSRYTKNVVRDVIYGCWCKGKRIGGGTVPPFFLISIATVLQKAGFDVTFLEAMAEQIPLNQIDVSPYKAVVTSTSTMSFGEDSYVLEYFKKQNPEILSVVYGSHTTFMPKAAVQRRSVDVAVRREPEYTVRDVLRAKRDGLDWRKTPGIAYLDPETGPVVNDRAEYLSVDDLPYLNTEFLPKDVHYFNPLVMRMPYMTLITSRGCPAVCSFCTAPFLYGTKTRFQSADRVLGEMEHLLSKGYREIYFRDETFFVDKDRDIQICEGIIKNKWDVVWICNTRVNEVSKELLKLAKEAGCHYIKFGVESGVQEILDNIHKGITVEETRQAFKWMNEVEIDSHAHTMLGSPGETLDTISTTINFITEIEPTTATFGVCTPYPGTPMFKMVEKRFPEIGDGTASDFSVLHTEGLYNQYYTSVDSKILETSIRRAYRSFYARPKYFVKTLKRVSNPEDFRRFTLAGAQVLDFAFRGE